MNLQSSSELQLAGLATTRGAPSYSLLRLVTFSASAVIALT